MMKKKSTPIVLVCLLSLLLGFVVVLPSGCGGQPQDEPKTESNNPVDGGSTPDNTTADTAATPDTVATPDTTTTPDASSGHLSFAKDIAPLVKKYSCGNGYCHGSGKGGLTLGSDDYAAFVNKKSKSGKWVLVVPGDPAKSLLYDKLAKDAPAEGGRMPPNGKLTDAELDLVRNWILQGAKP